MCLSAFNPRVLRITSLCRIVQMLIFVWAYSRRILDGHSGRSVVYCALGARRYSRLVNTRRACRCWHEAGHSALMTAEETRRWLLHSAWRIGKVHVLSVCAVFVRSQTGVEMCVKMLRLHIVSELRRCVCDVWAFSKQVFINTAVIYKCDSS